MKNVKMGAKLFAKKRILRLHTKRTTECVSHGNILEGNE